MSFVEGLTRVFRKKTATTEKQPEIKKESLGVVLVPKKVLVDRDYKKDGIVNEREIGKYFHNCALDVAKTLIAIYGEFFDMKNMNDDRQVSYNFTKGESSIIYSILGVPTFETSEGKKFSSDISGLLEIQQPSIDLKKAGKLINALMPTHLLDYRTPSIFGVFYLGNDSQSKLEGLPLLQAMDVKPTEAAEFFSVMMYGAYRHKIFAEGELEALAQKTNI